MDLGKVVAVIVLYKSNLKESETFRTLLKAIEGFNSSLTVLIYNNSPEYWHYEGQNFIGLDIIYLNDSLNSGVSKAYNTGFAYAKKMGKEFIFLLDQDTTLDPSLLRVFFAAEQKYKNSDNGLYCPMMVNENGLLSPAKSFLFTSRKMETISIGEHSIKGLAVINSGLIISTTLFELVGGYNEKIKLDFSDFDFLKRSRKFSGIIVLDVKCRHLLSGEEEMSKEKALYRFVYYLEGAKYYHKSFIGAIGLVVWIFLRGFKLDFKYKTTNFTAEVIQSVLKKA
jgi:rhamnosyltransferase